MLHTHRLDENDIVLTCTKNRDAAAAVGRKDLVQVSGPLMFLGYHFFLCDIMEIYV